MIFVKYINANIWQFFFKCQLTLLDCIPQKALSLFYNSIKRCYFGFYEEP